MKLKHTLWLVPAVLAVLAAGVEPSRAAASSKPNILVIVADDMGYSDPGCFGGEIQTPNLDSLAKGGLRYTQFYNTARCWPSRGALLTGFYAQQIRRDAMPGLPGSGQGIRPAWAKLLPEMLRPLGYRSYLSGKWHVDGKILDGGFDHAYCLEDHNRNFYPQKHTLDDKPLPPVQKGENYYTATAFANHAIQMLADHQTQHKDQPFFLYLAFTVPHFPLQAPEQDIAVYRERYQQGWDIVRDERYARMKQLGIVNCPLSKRDPVTIPHWNEAEEKLRQEIDPGEVGHAVPWNTLNDAQKKFQAAKMSIHAAMVHRMDLEIGRVLEKIKTMGAFDNTVVFFVSDNGASAEQMNRGDKHDPKAPLGSGGSFLCLGPGWSTMCNTPLRLHKSWVHEGGISTPLIVHWPQGIAARGELRQNPGHLIDITPTILDITGGKFPETVNGKPVPRSPGRSLVPSFAKDNSVAHDYFWWQHDGNRAIRVGDWKLVADHDAPWELYNLANDRAETSNLATGNLAKVKELEALYNQHSDEILKLATADLSPADLQKAKGKGKGKGKNKKAEEHE